MYIFSQIFDKRENKYSAKISTFTVPCLLPGETKSPPPPPPAPKIGGNHPIPAPALDHPTSLGHSWDSAPVNTPGVLLVGVSEGEGG